MPLELQSPWALGLLGLLGPLVVLYILKIKRQRLRVASTWLWRQARRDLMARSPFKRLVWQLPLLLQALGLIALAIAAARPTSRSKTMSGDHLALVIDTSASMSAIDAASGKRHIDLAKQSARELVRGLAPGSEAMIIDAGRDARIALPADRDTRRMERAIEAIEARDVEGDLGAALALAVGRLSQLAGRRQLVVITDGALARDTNLQGLAVPTEVIRVGAVTDNTAIVRIDVRSGTDPVTKREQVQAFVLVANFGDRPRDVFVTMRQHNASDTLASRKVLVPAHDKAPVVLSFHPTGGDYGSGLVLDVSPHDAMPVDDVAYARVPSGRRLPVVLAVASGTSPFLRRALASDPDAEVSSGAVPEALDPTTVAHDAFVVIDGACPAAPPGGDLLVVNPPEGECFGVDVGRSVDAPRITTWEQADPRLRFITLDDVALSKARVLGLDGPRQALIHTEHGAIAADVSSGARHATLLAFDVGDGNWPYRWSFVVFVRNLMEQARSHRMSGIAGPALAGDPLRASVPVAVEQVRVEGPGVAPKTLPARGGLVVVPEVARAGLYRVEWDLPRAGSLWVPVNLTSSAESDLSTEPTLTTAEIRAVVGEDEIERHKDYAWLLALAALGLIAFDVWYLTRKRPRVHVTAASAGDSGS